MSEVSTALLFRILPPAACASAIILFSLAQAAPAQRDWDFETRYWQALNEGRDVSPLIPTLDALTRPEKNNPPPDELRAKGLELLRRIEQEPPLEPVRNPTDGAGGKPGSDWPSLGGNPAHSGSTGEPGPVVGEELWRYPVGWPWKASARIDDGKIYIASPAIGTCLLCFDRASGRRLWAAPNPGQGTHRQARAASDVWKIGNDGLAFFKKSFDGWPLTYVVVSRDNGRILRSLPAAPQEQENEPPEKEPASPAACRNDQGTQVLVKSLQNGRTWWKFPTGYLPAEPVLSDSCVYAAGEDGKLWALNLRGDQRIAWTFTINASWGAPPAEGQGVLYAGANDGAVYALDAASGRLLWRSSVAQPDARSRQLFSPATVSSVRVYLGGTDGNLYALDAKDGKLAWKHPCGDWIRARPFVSGNMVCAATLEGQAVGIEDLGSQPRERWKSRAARHPVTADVTGDTDGILVSTSDFDLVALGLQDGSEQWRQSLIECTRLDGVKICADSMPDISQAPVTVAGGSVFFAGRDGFLLAADAVTGRLLWRFEHGGRMSATPTTAGNRVFVTQVGGNRLSYALDARTGQPLWSRDLGEVWAPPECGGDRLFIGNKAGNFYCLNPADGSILWQRRFGAGVYPAPALDNSTVYTGSWDGHYYALDRRTGDIVWAFSRPGRPYHVGGRPDSAAPVLVHDKVVVPNLGGRMIALDSRKGTLLWEWTGKPRRICNVTAASDGRIILASVFGNAYEWPYDVRLVGLDAADGKELWELPGFGGLTAPILTAGGRFATGSMGSPFLCGFQMEPSNNMPPRLLWRVKTGGVMYESLPAVSGNLGFFLSNDGWLRAIR